MTVLNLYCGIGGNRKLWQEVEVTAVEHDEKIAKIYQDNFPNDKVIIGDAHEYLLKHFQEFDFIWASPPCPTHSRLNFTNFAKHSTVQYPDMNLYQEIILLKTWFKGKFCVENVIGYYEPLIKPIESNSHYFWTNFPIRKIENKKRAIGFHVPIEVRAKIVGFDLKGYELTKGFEKKVLNNCTEPETGLHILDCARGIIRKENVSQCQFEF